MLGKINFLLDGNAGSSGKGKISDYIVNKEHVDFLITSNSANASHTVIRDGKEYIFKALPSGSIHHEKLEYVFIVDGASFELKALLEEIDMVGIPRSKVIISPRAGIITQIDKDFEAGLCDLDGNYGEKTHEGTIKTGTTASGSGSVLAKKVLRNKTLVTAKDIEEIADMVNDEISGFIMSLVNSGKTGFFEIGQGFPLSNNHKAFAPHTTSRNVTVSSALNDAFLPPYVCGNVIVNFRTYPIKIHSNKYKATQDYFFDYPLETTKNDILKNHTLFNPIEETDKKRVVIKEGDFLSWFEKDHVSHDIIESPSGDFYSDQEEITWEKLNESLGRKGLDIFECTTLTKLPRRIAEFSSANMVDAVMHNNTGNKTFISLNFVNYVDNDLYGLTLKDYSKLEESEKFKDWMEKYRIELFCNNLKADLSLFGTGESNEHILDKFSV